MIQRNSLLLSLFCGLVVAACAPAAPLSQSTQVATAAAAPETAAVAAAAAESQPAAASNKRVCKTVIPTGTRFQKRDCRTQAEWDRIQEGGRAAGEDIQRKGVQTGNPYEPTGNRGQ